MSEYELELNLPDGRHVIVFISVFVTLSCDVRHNDDSICKIASSLFFSLVYSHTSGIFNYIQNDKNA